MRRQAWVAIILAILVGGAVGGAVAIAGTDDGKDIFQGAPTGPTPSDPVAAEIDAVADDAYTIDKILVFIGAAGTADCAPGSVCGIASPSSRLDTLIQRCTRSGYPDDALKGKSDKGQALIDAVNAACGRAVAITDKRPTTDAQWSAFAKVSMPALEDSYLAVAGHAISNPPVEATK